MTDKDRRPLPVETLGEYIDRVIVGHTRIRKRAETQLDLSYFEVSYVFSPYVPFSHREKLWELANLPVF